MRPTTGLGAAISRLRAGWLPLLESTAAATLAWLIATRLVGHPQPFFAPAAALIVLGQTRGQRVQRAVEVLLGVAGGVLVADVVAQALGPHTTWTIFTVILLTLTLAVMLGASTLLMVQAAVSALYVAVVTPPTTGLVPFRFVDALVGGSVAVVASQLAVARHPLALLLRELERTFDDLANVLADIAAALDQQDETAALAALNQARRADASLDQLRTAVTAASEALRLHVRRRQQLGGVRTVDVAIRQVDLAVRNVRVLARAGVTLIRLPTVPSPELAGSVRSLGVAVGAVHEALVAELVGPQERVARCAERAEAAALDAVRMAGRLLPEEPPLPLVMIVGQLRSTVIDLLRGVGADDIEILTQVDEALGLPPL